MSVRRCALGSKKVKILTALLPQVHHAYQNINIWLSLCFCFSTDVAGKRPLMLKIDQALLLIHNELHNEDLTVSWLSDYCYQVKKAHPACKKRFYSQDGRMLQGIRCWTSTHSPKELWKYFENHGFFSCFSDEPKRSVPDWGRQMPFMFLIASSSSSLNSLFPFEPWPSLPPQTSTAESPIMDTQTGSHRHA